MGMPNFLLALSCHVLYNYISHTTKIIRVHVADLDREDTFGVVRTCCIVGVAFRIRYSASRDGCRGNLGVPTEGACPGLEGA